MASISYFESAGKKRSCRNRDSFSCSSRKKSPLISWIPWVADFNSFFLPHIIILSSWSAQKLRPTVYSMGSTVTDPSSKSGRKDGCLLWLGNELLLLLLLFLYFSWEKWSSFSTFQSSSSLSLRLWCFLFRKLILGCRENHYKYCQLIWFNNSPSEGCHMFPLLVLVIGHYTVD